MNTTENNILIAEFLGEPAGGLTGKYCFSEHGYLTLSGEFKTDFHAHELKFHKQWNWIMPVVIRAQEVARDSGHLDLDIKFGSRASQVLRVRDEKSQVRNWEVVICEHSKSDLETTYKTIVEFIKAYNND